SACLIIAIRTMLFDPSQQRVYYSVGGGIVADSKPDAEFDETIHKAQAMLKALTGQMKTAGRVTSEETRPAIKGS
ncbi:MAG: chorismate-binding protein, partial [Phycisphaeraceae bacterium]